MNIYPTLHGNGRVRAFEVENAYISVSKIAALLRSVSKVSDIRVRRLFGRPSDVHVEFCYLKVKFVVWEPFADNSRYWIGPEDETADTPDVQELLNVFAAYRPPMLIRMLGDLVSLRVFSISKSREAHSRDGASDDSKTT